MKFAPKNAEVDDEEQAGEQAGAARCPSPSGRRATVWKSSVVMIIVPVTAMPYAAARFVDDRKPSTSAMQPTQSA